jgi:hypothetical protein
MVNAKLASQNAVFDNIYGRVMLLNLVQHLNRNRPWNKFRATGLLWITDKFHKDVASALLPMKGNSSPSGERKWK